MRFKNARGSGVEDEKHVVFECTANDGIRGRYTTLDLNANMRVFSNQEETNAELRRFYRRLLSAVLPSWADL